MLRLLATSFLLMTYLLGMTLSVQATVKLEAVGASPDITEPSMFKKKGKYDNRSYPYPSPVTVKIRNLYKTNSELEVATFAGGGFWGVEAEFEKMPGVREVFSGFMGGHVDNPTYRQVSDGSTGHYEVVEIYYDPKRVSYSQLTEKLWRISNPTNSGGGEKYGNQYASAIFYHNETQRVQAESSRRQLEQSGIFELPVRTRITKASRFYLADNAHQDHYLYVPLWYKGYQKNATARQHKLWGDKKTFKKRDDDVLKENLTPLQYRVTQNGRTEMSWKNEYWNNKASGIYVDVVTGEPLFSSRDKYNAETGWPSFSKPLMSSSVVEHNDTIPGPWMEVKSRHGNSHLGHVFYNQPKSSTGLRYCINSASLRFIRKADLVKEGYGRYMTLFENVEAQ